MDITAILLAAKAAAEALSFLTGLAHTLSTEGRDPTPAELADVKSRQKAAEDAWAALLPPNGPA